MGRTKINYRKIYEEYHRCKIPKNMHIHHIDGDSHNNEIHNLIMVTPEQHIILHEQLGHKKLGNFIKKANNQLGIPCSSKKKLNISKSLKNKKLSEEHKIKIAKKLAPIEPFLVFEKTTGKLIGKFHTKGTCQSSLGLPPNKIRKCLNKDRHSIGKYFLIYEKEFYSGMNIANHYKTIISNSLKKMGESQRRRLCTRRS